MDKHERKDASWNGENYSRAAFLGLVIAALLVALMLLEPFIHAIIWAVVLSVLTFPVYLRLKKRMNENAASILTVLFTMAVVVVPLATLGTICYSEISVVANEMQAGEASGQKSSSVDQLGTSLDKMLGPVLDRFNSDFVPSKWIDENREELTKNITSAGGKILVSLGKGALGIVVALLTMFFMLRDGHRLRRPAVELLPWPEARTHDLLNRWIATIKAVFAGVVLVALIQGAIAGCLYVGVGAPQPLLLAVATAFLAMIPLLGPPVLFIPVAVLFLAQGAYWQAAVVAGVGFGIISQIDNLLRPIFISARISLPTIAIFFSLLGGVLFFGPVGIMAGPMLLTLLLVLQEHIREQRGFNPEPPPAESAS